MFVDLAGLQKHSITHQKLKVADRKCAGCGKGDFLREKSKKEHWRVCPANPDRVGALSLSSCRVQKGSS